MWSSIRATTSSSLSPRATNPHSHLICLDIFLSRRLSKPVLSHMLAGTLEKGWKSSCRPPRPSAFSSAAGSCSNSMVGGPRRRCPAGKDGCCSPTSRCNRDRAATRDELVEALWPYATPAAAPSALTVLVSKLRAALGTQLLCGRSDLRLNLPPDTRIDVEDALAAVHEAQSAVALGDWKRAWGPALRAQFIARRRLLPEHDTPWLDHWRQRLDDVHDNALEVYATSCLGIGGTELPGAERAARGLLDHSPLRETGYALLMDALAARGNVAEAMRVYDRARTILDQELGITPGRAIPASPRPPARYLRRTHLRITGSPIPPAAEGFSLSLAKQALHGNLDDVIETVNGNVRLA